jgi:hypothetical protein
VSSGHVEDLDMAAVNVVVRTVASWCVTTGIPEGIGLFLEALAGSLAAVASAPAQPPEPQLSLPARAIMLVREVGPSPTAIARHMIANGDTTGSEGAVVKTLRRSPEFRRACQIAKAEAREAIPAGHNDGQGQIVGVD